MLYHSTACQQSYQAMSHDIKIFQCLPKIFEHFKPIWYKTPRKIPCFSYIRAVNIICVDKILSNIQNLCIISLYLLSILPILMELSTPCNGRNIRWFLKASAKQLNQKRFCYQTISLVSFIDIYRKNSFVLTRSLQCLLWTYCPDNASYKIIVFSLA